jgi:P-type E1-E2 ATPase
MLSPRAVVVPTAAPGDRCDDLVPGDLVILASGDRVPADVRLLDVAELRVDESALTGESLPAEKRIAPTLPDAPLGDRFDMAYSGTLIVHGQARGVIVAVGSATELGLINRMLADVQGLATPLLRQVNRFGRMLAIAILGASLLTFVLGTLWRNHAPAEMFMMVVALAASAIPEGLPAIITVGLALGVQRMARRRAIVRHLPAVEALGSVTVICSDKIGRASCRERVY